MELPASVKHIDPSKIQRAQFPQKYDIAARDEFYKSFFNDWPGRNGCDSVLISYDAILGAGNNWDELALRAILHGGDNDSTGTIAGAWWAALHGFKGVPKCNYQNMEAIKEHFKNGKMMWAKFGQSSQMKPAIPGQKYFSVTLT